MQVSPRYLRRYLLKTYGLLCFWCGGVMRIDGDPNHKNYASIEHLRRRSRGGRTGLTNCVMAHRRCNNERHTPGWTPHLSKEPFANLQVSHKKQFKLKFPKL